MNKKKNVLCLTLLMLICITITFIWNYKGNKEYKLDEVELKNNIKINNKNLAIMVQKEDGSGYEEADTFPSGLALNISLSGCIDKNGNAINGSVEYNVDTMNLKLKTKGSSYCYLYFVRDNEAPVVSINTIDNYYTSAKLSILSNEDGTYCINTSNIIKDTSNCVLEGTLSENSMIVTKVFTESGTYYAHIKDNAGNETMSEALDIKVLYQKVEYIETTGTQYINSGVYATDSSIDFTLQFTNGTIATQGVIGSRVSYSEGSTRNNLFWNYKNNYMLRLDWNGIGSNDTYTNELSLNTDIVVSLKEKGNVIVNNVEYNSNTTKNSSSLNIYIGNFNNNGTPFTTGAYAKWKTVKMYTSGELVRDFIPVYRTSDNVIGMFDEVNKVFYTNSGSGTFGKGSNFVLDLPIINTNVIDEDENNPKIVFISNKAGNYCINKNSSRTDMSDCVQEGNILENEFVTSETLYGGVYYVHVKDDLGNVGVSCIELKGNLLLSDYLIENNISGLQQTLIGTDTLYRFSGTNGNTGINNYICLGATTCTSGSENMYRIIGVEPSTGYVKVINTGTYGLGQINSTTTIPTWVNSTLYSSLNGTWYNNLSFNNLIQEHSWNVGAISSTSYANNRSTVLSYEDNSTVTANVGILSLSDYYLAYNGDVNWNTNYSSYTKSWIHADRIWTMAYASSSAGYWILDATGQVRITTGVNNTTVNVRPTFFLKSNIIRVDGDGTSSNPFIIELAE